MRNEVALELPGRTARLGSMNLKYIVNANGLPTLVSEFEIVAGGPLTRIPYCFDTPDFQMTVTKGGQPTLPYTRKDGKYGVDIELENPLLEGDCRELECTTHFSTKPSKREFMFHNSHTLSHLSLGVVFVGKHYPQNIRYIYRVGDHTEQQLFVNPTDVYVEGNNTTETLVSVMVEDVTPGTYGIRWWN